MVAFSRVEVSDGGKNVSQYKKEKVLLARALIYIKSKILS